MMIINRKLRWTSLVVTLFLFGCSSTGGSIGGLIPAPKATKGELRSGIYTSQDKIFEINVPFPVNSTAYSYMQIEETYLQNETHIVFSSTLNPAEVYRVDLFCKLPEESNMKSAHELAKVIRDQYSAQFSAAYGNPLINQQADKALPNEFTYTQIIPERKSGTQRALGFTVQHSSYAFKKENCLAHIWVNFPISEKALPSGAELRKAQFINSFRWNQ
ncbi:hypothetical protein [Parvibium lacunae]|uniref:Lipoprotein n=1 Tax=Parvibium lacunae TaxID=1888893 RepID=A0A368KZZ8_9BURK|nr:hypothetical protein [Parvibium lacunae]RCS56870.1 hypothetical protein DU000_11060 [Parvibium lacunae]